MYSNFKSLTAYKLTRKTYNIGGFKGVDTTSSTFEVDKQHALNEVNFIRYSQVLEKRKSFQEEMQFDDKLPISNVWEWASYFVLHRGKNLTIVSKDLRSVYKEFTNIFKDEKAVSGFVRNKKLWILSGTYFYYLDENLNLVKVEDEAEVPTTTIGIVPNNLVTATDNNRKTFDGMNNLTYFHKNEFYTGIPTEFVEQKPVIDPTQELVYTLDLPFSLRDENDLEKTEVLLDAYVDRGTEETIKITPLFDEYFKKRYDKIVEEVKVSHANAGFIDEFDKEFFNAIIKIGTSGYKDVPIGGMVYLSNKYKVEFTHDSEYLNTDLLLLGGDSVSVDNDLNIYTGADSFPAIDKNTIKEEYKEVYLTYLKNKSNSFTLVKQTYNAGVLTFDLNNIKNISYKSTLLGPSEEGTLPEVGMICIYKLVNNEKPSIYGKNYKCTLQRKITVRENTTITLDEENGEVVGFGDYFFMPLIVQAVGTSSSDAGFKKKYVVAYMIKKVI